MDLLEKNLLPDWLIRAGIRRLLAVRLRDENKGDIEKQKQHLMAFVEELKQSPIAVHTADANNQHYQVPTEFFLLTLGKHLKYSGGYWPAGCASLDDSEDAMLKLTAQRARLENGQNILELGCGWGSLSLYMAATFPGSRVTGVSNSKTQKAYIDAQAQKRALKNLEIITCDMNEFQAPGQYDRVVSVEMFEHMRNYEKLLAKIASWMKPRALLFVHIFTHLTYAYPFEVKDATDWMAKYFFTGGIMPSDDLLLHFQKDVRLIKHWRVDGTHYQKTSEAWLANMDKHKAEVMAILEKTYGPQEKVKRWVYWRVFFMACAELFGYKNGQEWLVSHYLFEGKG